ncbi:MAG: serine/threonine protein kinase [Planctomycetes bacterium]|nr:serine/threonine protein kinase [Planctomycetota bacterium]
MSDEQRYNRIQSFLVRAPGEPVPKAPDLPPPELGTVGHYRLIRQVARGGAATVFEAQDTRHGRKVALKVLTFGAGNPLHVARLQREAAIASRLRHPNIVGVHDTGMVANAEGQTVHYIAMDFVEGRSLAYLLKDPLVKTTTLLGILNDVADAVAYLHARGIVHRDLKPGNVLVDASGRGIVADFGLARSADRGSPSLTGLHEVLGTPQYMAPEQVEGRTKDIGPWTDIWSLGVMLYQILARRLPFGGTSVAEIQTRILTEPPPPPSSLAAAVNPRLEALCLRALSRDPSRRPPDASVFADDLRRP